MAEDSSELDEIVQAPSWHASATTTSSATTANPATPDTRLYADNQNTSSLGDSNKVPPVNVHQTLEDSTTNGFTTAPATSDDDFDSDDDDDSRSIYSNKNTSNSNSMISNSERHSKYGARHAIKGEQKRSHHNVLERKRRDLLKDSFAMLRNTVPMSQPKERVSRAEILKQAADFIQSTVKRNASVRQELDELLRKNREFEEQQQQERSRKAVGGSAPVGSSGADVSQLVTASGSGEFAT